MNDITIVQDVAVIDATTTVAKQTTDMSKKKPATPADDGYDKMSYLETSAFRSTS
jgi:hypothetical protein